MTEFHQTPKNYRDFMRGRRPELYSDTLQEEVPEMDRRQFEYHLHSLTSRKEETAFENFARALAQKELCPNLIPQTGPTGGGDSKTDTETYPVAASISNLWYTGNPDKSSVDRWAFAISAKAKWKPKVDSDVAKIVGTGRPYKLIYFISNQSIRDKDRADTEDALKAKYGIEVRILDKTWIVDCVHAHDRWELVEETLHFELPRKSKPRPGPLDVERLQDFERLEKEIEVAAGTRTDSELVEECLQSALLARGLEKPRVEVDGRFERAERVARDFGNSQQIAKIKYLRAWTALWWFNDADEALRLYDVLAAESVDTYSVWELEKLVNLWLALLSQKDVAGRTTTLRLALDKLADSTETNTHSLWAKTQLLLMDLVATIQTQSLTAPIFEKLRSILNEAQRYVEFPMESVVKLVRELADLIGDTSAYDELLECIIEIESSRHGDQAAGELRLERGLRKLTAKKSYDAIEDLSKSQFLLANAGRRHKFITALSATGFAYESVGLLYAARANLVNALDRCLYTMHKDGTVDGRAPFILRRLVWIEAQLGRLPYAFCWIQLLTALLAKLNTAREQKKEIVDELQAIDRILGILILKTSYDEWHHLTRLPDALGMLELHFSQATGYFGRT